MTQYKIQVGSWTKLPNGKVQEDTRDIMRMMGKVCGVDLEKHVTDVGNYWLYVSVLHSFKSRYATVQGEPHVVIHDGNDEDYVIGHEPSLFIPYEELQKMLNAPAVPTVQNVPSLLNTKLDCRKPDGSVDEELSRAFQEACFEQGFISKVAFELPFLFITEGRDFITWTDSESYFDNHENKQINFKYSRTLTWEATFVEPDIIEEDKMVDICGVEYSAKELSEALALIHSSRASARK